VKAKAPEAALVLFAFACLSLLATFPLVLHLGRALPGDLGDPLFTSWLLGWDADRLRHGLHAFWDAPILFPSRNTVAFSEHMLGIAVPIAPIIWLTGNPILGYDVAFLPHLCDRGIGDVPAGSRAHGRSRRGVPCRPGVRLLADPRSARLASPGARMGMDADRAVGACTAIWRSARGSRSPCVVAAFTTQAFSNGYFLYYLAIVSAVVVIVELIARPGPTSDCVRMLGALVAAAAVILIAVGAVAVAYLSVRRQYGFLRPYDDWTMFSANVQSYVTVPATVRLWPAWLHGDLLPERQLFPGLVVLVAAAAAFWPGAARRRTALLYGALAAGAFVLSLGPEPSAGSHRLLASGPYLWLVRIVPGMDGLRVPARSASSC